MRRYYERLAPEYDDSIPGLGDKAEHPKGGEDMPDLLPAISLVPPARVLDVACGAGFLTRRPAGEVVGLNRSETMLEIARKGVRRPSCAATPCRCRLQTAPSTGSSPPASVACSRSRTGYAP
jgi:ubiquinone/menaquinone biosynthesis C-methylase UbiE